mmetsp:Transcript_12206/g.23410  ORF Transcript_12206/g.23410 Transcript_12206/m.23410 type:complete len:260 (-) Transcript_12206:39-818(-)
MSARWIPRAMRRAQRKGANPVGESTSRARKGVTPMEQEEESTSATTIEGIVEETPGPMALLLEDDEKSDYKSSSPKDVLANNEIETWQGPEKPDEASEGEDTESLCVGDSSCLQSEASAKMPAYPSPAKNNMTVGGSSLQSAASAKMAAYPSPEKNNMTMVPIAPGLHARLRGANETWECIEHDFYLPTSCFACSQDICVIMDADFVICPNCRVVSPLGEDNDSSPHSSRELTVGLGFTFEDLAKWQEEIVAKRNGFTM